MAIARLWAAETVWLTVIGGALGLLACQWLIGLIIALAPEGIPRLGRSDDRSAGRRLQHRAS